MKKLIILLLFFCLAASGVSAKKIFVEMGYKNNVITLDDGQNKDPQPVKDENGKKVKFKTLVAALNYMSSQGWELVESVSKRSIGNTYIPDLEYNRVYYLFSKEVPDEELDNAVNNGYKD